MTFFLYEGFDGHLCFSFATPFEVSLGFSLQRCAERIMCYWSLPGSSPLIETVWKREREREGPRYNPADMDGRKTQRTELCCLRHLAGSRVGLQGMNRYLVLCAMVGLVLATDASPSKTCDKNCLSGKCVNGSCVCDRGWVGDQCQHCHGRFKWVYLFTCSLIIRL